VPKEVLLFKEKPVIPTQRARKYEERAILRDRLKAAELDGAWMAVKWDNSDPKTPAGRRNMLRVAAREVGLEIEFTRWGWAYKGHSIVRVVGRS